MKGQPLLNERCSVSKNEVVDSVELPRLIMNLIPVNRLLYVDHSRVTLVHFRVLHNLAPSTWMTVKL